MPRVAYVNGQYLPHYAAAVHVEDRGYQFADGVYEVIAVRGGRLIDEAGHLDRLDRSLAELRIRAPMARALLQAVPAETDQQRVQLVLAEEQVLRDAKQYHEALKVLNAALMHLPGSHELLYARALVAERLDMLALVESDLRAVLARDPKNVNALNALGYTLADRTERYAEAEALLKQALEQRPDDPFILDSWGWLQYRMGNTAEAIRHLKRALSIRGDAEIAAHLGEVLWMTGDRREAESVWTRALRDEPDSEVLRNVIRKFKP